jgi:hypothetical protein
VIAQFLVVKSSRIRSACDGLIVSGTLIVTFSVAPALTIIFGSDVSATT